MGALQQEVMSQEFDPNYDVIVVGAGPAGASAAAILAGNGRRVALIEKESTPYYRVGESLIPFCWYPLDRLGLVDEVASSSFVVEKNSVQFAGLSGKVSKPFYFFQHTDHPCARTWQVVRREFDRMLLRNALEKGAIMHAETTVKGLLMDDSGRVTGVRAGDAARESFELNAPLTIDASGRKAISQGQLGWRVPDPVLRKLAIWTYYEGALRDEGVDEGTTTIAYLPEKGWFWYIPLPDDRASVGVVAEKDYLFRDGRDPAQIFEREVRTQPWISERLEHGRRVDEFRTTSEFSYRSKHCAMDGLVLAGDAFAFLDPVFSSGVYYALWSGVMAADAAHAALAAGDCSAARFTAYGEEFRKQMEPMRRLVYAFYDGDFNFGKFLKSHPGFRSELTDCLIGDLDRDFEPFFKAVAEFAHVPDPLGYGGPLV
ncbi:MAG: flavin-dependent dehydrogenase [Chlamydiales bacterium]|jgi:flavin-dependent dehydrogenase